MQQTADGGYIIAGDTASFGTGGGDAYLIKTDKEGRELWSRTFGGKDYDAGYSVQQTTDGGYIVAGLSKPYDAPWTVVYLVKTDENGKQLWSRTFGGNGDAVGHSVQQTADGGYIIAGYANSFGSRAADVYLIKTDKDGEELWSCIFGGNDDDRGFSVRQTTDGGYIIAGYTNSFGAGAADVYLIKTDKDGNELWNRTFGGTGTDEGYSVQQIADGGYIIAGYTNSYGAGAADVYLIKTDKDGNKVWSRTFGGKSFERGHSVQQTADGGYIIAGYTNSFGAGAADVYLIKTDKDGNELWSRTFGGKDDDEAYSVQQTADGGYIIAGDTNSYGAGGYDVYLIKTDAQGRSSP